MNKFELKEKLIEISNEIENMTRELMSQQMDEEAGEIRSEVYTYLCDMYEYLSNKIYGIY